MNLRYLKKGRSWRKISSTKTFKKLRRLFQYRKKDRERSFYKKLLNCHASRNDLIFDVGANMGNKTLVFSKLARKVIAFEPSERLKNFLNEKFRNTNIILYDCALGSKTATAEFFTIDNQDAYNSLNYKHIETTATNRGITRSGNVRSTKVKVDVLENFISKHGLPKYIKIDVEGYELEVIRGLKTAVPLISFEANLPEFLPESTQTIKYLNKLSSGAYKFNFTTSDFFLLETSISGEEAINYLSKTRLSYLEIYASLC